MAIALNVPKLRGWITIAEAAVELGVTKQAVHKMIGHREIKTTHRVGDKPVYIVRQREVDELKRARDAAAQARAEQTEEELANI